MKKAKKSSYRIVPHVHEKIGPCWALKEKETIVGTFISKQHAERRQRELEAKLLEDFLLKETVKQELKVLED